MMKNTSVTRSNASFVHSSNRSVLGEPQAVTLQRETENYIRKLEQEKR